MKINLTELFGALNEAKKVADTLGLHALVSKIEECADELSTACKATPGLGSTEIPAPPTPALDN